MRPGLLVVAATRAEMPRRLGALGAAGLVVGIGARRMASGLPGEGPVLVVGTCGALREGWPPGSLLLATGVADARGRVEPDRELTLRLAAAAERSAIAVREARLVEARSVIEGEEERRAWARDTGADAVDLESARIGRACEAAGRPWAVLRVISDAPGSSLGWLRDALGAWPEDEPGTSRIVRALARRPSILPRLVALGSLVKHGREATRSVLAALDGG